MARLPIELETNTRTYDGVLSPKRCKRLISAFTESSHLHDLPGPDGETFAETVFLDPELSGIEADAERERWTKLIAGVYKRYAPVLDAFNQEFKYLVDKTVENEGYRFLRFRRGRGHTPLHRDVGTDRPTLVFTLIFFLNDVAEGGEVEFPYQRLRVLPKAGRLIIAPPFWTHIRRSRPPMSDDQFVLETCFRFLPEEVEDLRSPEFGKG